MELNVRVISDWVPSQGSEMRLGSEAPRSFRFRMCVMSPDRLWSFLWGELLLLPAQMWTELNMNIWSRKPHTGSLGTQWHAYRHIGSTLSSWSRGFRGTGKRPSCCASLPPSLPPAPLGPANMDPWNGLLFPSVSALPLTYTSHASCVPVEQN